MKGSILSPILTLYKGQVWGSFVDTDLDWCRVSVTEVLYAIYNHNRLHYDDYPQRKI